MERKHYHTQLLFHHQPKRLRHGDDSRHLYDQSNPAFVYHVKGDSASYCEYKGLRHDCEVRYEKAHTHDVCGPFLPL